MFFMKCLAFVNRTVYERPDLARGPAAAGSGATPGV